MEVRFGDDDLDRLESDPRFTANLPPEVVTRYRKVLNFIRHAMDERDLRAWPALRFEKLKERMDGAYSMRLNLQWRLLVDLEGTAPNKIVVVQKIDNHYGE
jgi:proteic killer suppression protein